MEQDLSLPVQVCGRLQIFTAKEMTDEIYKLNKESTLLQKTDSRAYLSYVCFWVVYNKPRIVELCLCLGGIQ